MTEELEALIEEAHRRFGVNLSITSGVAVNSIDEDKDDVLVVDCRVRANEQDFNYMAFRSLSDDISLEDATAELQDKATIEALGRAGVFKSQLEQVVNRVMPNTPEPLPVNSTKPWAEALGELIEVSAEVKTPLSDRLRRQGVESTMPPGFETAELENGGWTVVKSEPPSPSSPTLTCSDCNLPIVEYTAGAATLPVAEIAKRTTKLYGRHLCFGCNAEAHKQLRIEKAAAKVAANVS